MSTGVRVPLAEGLVEAERLRAFLASACERIEIAGSIRRRRPDVGDVELVAVPRIRIEERPQMGLWTDAGGSTALDGRVEVDELGLRISALGFDGIIAHHPERPAEGRRYRRFIHVASGLQLDLFAVLPPAQWGVIFAIRTGPAAWSEWLVTEARRRRFHVAGGALHRGSLKCSAIPCEVVDTPEERDVFEALGLPWQPPEARR